MEGKLRIVSGKQVFGRIGNTDISNPQAKKQERPVSAISRKIDFNKSVSPNKGVKKYNVNVNVNLNGNNSTIGESLPKIGGNNNDVVPQKLNYSQIITQNVDKSPKPLSNKLRIVKNNSPTNTNQTTIENSNVLDENFKLKNALNKLKSDVTYYRSESNKFENELKLKEKVIEDLLQIEENSTNPNMNMYSTINTSHIQEKNKTREYQIIINLKKQFKEIQNTLKQKEEEIENMKKLSKVAKMNQLILDNRTLNQELERIKTLYDNALINEAINEKSSKEVALIRDNFSKQQNLINVLQDRNSLLLDESNQKSHKINKLKEKMKEMKEEINKIKNSKRDYLNTHDQEENLYNLVEEKNLKLAKKKEKSKKLKEEIASKIEEINLLKKQIKYTGKNSEFELIQEELENKIKLKKANAKKLKANLKEKSEEIEKLIQQVNELSSQNYNGIHEEHIKYKEETVNKINKMKMKHSGLKNKLREKEEELEKCKTLLNEINFIENNDDNDCLKDKIRTLQKKLFESSKEVEYYKELTEKREKMLHAIQELHMKNALAEINTLADDIMEQKYTSKIDQLNGDMKEKISEIENMENKTTPNIDDENLPMTENQFNEFTYILIKNFEAHQITMKLIEENIFNNINSSDILEESVDNIMRLLNNKNSANKEELFLYLKFIGITYGSDFDVLKEHFLNLLESITSYSNETCEILNQKLKNCLIQYNIQLKTELRRKDPHNSGYITFFNLRKILEQLNIEIDLNLMEFFIYQMKKFNDPDSSFRDLKYNFLINLLIEEPEFPVIEERRESNTASLSQVFIPDKEYNSRTEIVLSRIAEVLFSKGISTRKLFIPTIIIQERIDKCYTAMYLKLFLKLIQEEIQLVLDVTDSLCLFNRLKNSDNVYNIEVVDIDKLVEEMAKFGIYECDEEIFTEGNANLINTTDKKSSQNLKDVINGNNRNNPNSLSQDNHEFAPVTKYEENIEHCEINLISELRNYIRRHKVPFEKIIFLVHPYMILNNFSHDRLIELEILVVYLVEYNIIFSNIIDCNSLVGILNQNFININALKKAVYEEEEDNKRISKVYSTVDEIKIVKQEQENYEKEKVSKDMASRFTSEFIFEAILKFKDNKSNENNTIQKENTSNDNSNDIQQSHV